MKVSLTALICLTAASAVAAAPHFRVGEEPLGLRWVDSVSGVLITQGCDQRSPCKALEAYVESQKRVEKPGAYPREAGVNPGSLACRQRFKAEVFLATGRPGETQGFCRFADKSIISLNGLNP